MRVKVEGGLPLPSFKAWFVVPSVSTVSDLKGALCASLPTLVHAQTSPDAITLNLDGFELLDDSSIDVVRDGDLITVKPSASPNTKRKASDEDNTLLRKKPRHDDGLPNAQKETVSVTTVAAKKPASKPTAESDISDTDTDTDSDSSTSDSSSESSSDSDSDSSSSSDSAPSEKPSKVAVASAIKTPLIAKPNSALKTPAPTFVPPGHGKPATHSRNVRRRKKKQYERATSHEELANANEVPLGRKSRVDDAHLSVPETIEVQQTIMMASLSNKNKRRGFKQAMAGKIPKKIVFSSEGNAEAGAAQRVDELPFASGDTAEVVSAAPNLFPRLVPPSELQEQGLLPPNMFVTSIDVEEGMHPQRRKGKKSSQQQQQQKATPNGFEEMQVEETITLDYGDADDMMTTQRDPAPSQPDTQAKEAEDWSSIEAKWDSLAKITDKSQVNSGAVVAWKALAINPATFTPEFLLNIGRVTGCDAQLTVLPLHRPGAVDVSFGTRYGDEGGDEEGEDTEVVLEEETYEWIDVLAGEWRRA